ncbi:MAG: 4Fe-4S dicluster domain-containing protein [Acidobacteria bacterium]|nr:4Fe-4S dicluster domain-containing protein [Acidobacteriota bacterium]
MKSAGDRNAGLSIIEREELGTLIDVLGARGYQVIGPVVSDGAIVYDRIASLADLPEGLTDEQDGGRYRLKQRDDRALFGYVVGPHSWKKYLHPPRIRLFRAECAENGLRIIDEEQPQEKFAFIGARSCELHAIAIQDRVLLDGVYPDAVYRARRENLFVVAVNCGTAGGTCFCTSMNTGPKATTGYDLALTEIPDPDNHRFLVEPGTALGAEILGALSSREATPDDETIAEQSIARAVEQMENNTRRMDATGIRELLLDNLEHARWDDVAQRCLTCANCTMVCPTCFCTTVEDTTDLTGDHAERWRRWDSCFTQDFSYIHGGSVRVSPMSRYRQWMTHKLATWIDQFGVSGCVGCGRCITWCPVGIDITEEIRAIRGQINGCKA